MFFIKPQIWVYYSMLEKFLSRSTSILTLNVFPYLIYCSKIWITASQIHFQVPATNLIDENNLFKPIFKPQEISFSYILNCSYSQNI